MEFSAAVIGLGQIGQEYDYHIHDESHIMTHAQAFHHHHNYHLLAGVDVNQERRFRFEDKFKKKSYPCIESMFQENMPDVIAIATPLSQQFDLFEKIIKFKPKTIICEKPLAYDLKTAKKMLDIAAQFNIPLLVNYIRRFEPGIQLIKQMMMENAIGDVYKIIGHYTKGILNNGSHLIDLLFFLFGKFDHFNITKTRRAWNNLDPEPDIYFTINEIDGYLLSGREECFSMFSFELIGTKGVLKYLNGGRVIKLYHAEKDKILNNYQFLNLDGRDIPHNYLRYQFHVLEHLFQHLSRSTPLNSDGKTAYQTLEIITAIIHKARETL